MANTVTSNTNLAWLQENWGGPSSNSLQFDVYTFNHKPSTLAQEINLEDFTGSVGVETLYKSLGQQIIVVWREDDTPTTFTGNSSYIIEGWS
jgi:hypothetical protein